jgi:hypothetical protein
VSAAALVSSDTADVQKLLVADCTVFTKMLLDLAYWACQYNTRRSSKSAEVTVMSVISPQITRVLHY